MTEQGDFYTLKDCKFFMEKDEFKKFRGWILGEKGIRLANGSLAYPYETIAKFYILIGKDTFFTIGD